MSVGERVRHKYDLRDIPGTVMEVGDQFAFVAWDKCPDPPDTPYDFNVLELCNAER
jgi:hypothetical protein